MSAVEGRNGKATMKKPQFDSENSTFKSQTAGHAIDSIKTNLQLSFQFGVTFPEYPSVPLLYTPPVKGEVFDFPRGVSSVDLEVMSTGLVEAVPLCPPPATMERHRALSDVVRATNAQAAALERIYYTPQEANRLLSDEDFRLVDTELDKSILESRDLPNLRSLMKPTYTEIGLAPAVVRATARDERLHPHWEQKIREQAALRAATPMADTPTRADTTTVFTSGSVDPAAMWMEATKASFKHARLVDECFVSFLRFIAARKLGLLDSAECASSQVHTHDDKCVTFAFCFLRQIQSRTPETQRQGLWNAFREAAVDPETKLDTLGSLVNALSGGSDDWGQLARRFSELRSVARDGGADGGVLPFSPEQELQADGKSITVLTLLDSLARPANILRHPTKPNVFPVEVIPILPSHFPEAIHSASSIIPPALAGDAKGLTKVTLLGCTRRAAGPHIIDRDGTLLEGDGALTARLEPRQTFATHGRRADLFENITVEDGVTRVGTSGILLHLCSATSDVGDGAGIAAISPQERRVAVYNALPKTRTMRRQTKARARSPDYVVGLDERLEQRLKKQPRKEGGMSPARSPAPPSPVTARPANAMAAAAASEDDDVYGLLGGTI
jgi:hypothetical protein